MRTGKKSITTVRQRGGEHEFRCQTGAPNRIAVWKGNACR
jgi:hypothetical protein